MKQIAATAILSIQFLISSFLFAYSECPQQDSRVISLISVDDRVVLQNPIYLANMISNLLCTSGYAHDSSKISLHKSQKHQIAIVETDKGKKFIKIKKRGEGIHEYLGMHVFKDFFSIIPTEKLILSHHLELVVQPFISSAESNLLFHKMMALEGNENGEIWTLIHSLFLDSLKISNATMHHSITSANNDDFFFNRLKTQALDGISGRLENIYQGKKFQLMHLELPWEELKRLHWSIDGICYQETIEELLTQCRHNLDPNKPRLIGISHGNWHENNILINETNDPQSPYDYTYFALDFAGENDLITDAIMFLTHTAIYADYLNPVYYQKAYGNHTIEEQTIKCTLQMKKRTITLSQSNGTVNINGTGSFGTFPSRKKVAHLFYEHYFHPLTKHAAALFGESILSKIDHHAKAALLLRLLGGQNVSKMTPEDQVKIIALIYQSIGTPIERRTMNTTAVCRFLNAL